MDDSDHNAAQQRQIASEARGWLVRLNSGQVSREELQRFYAWRELSPAHRRTFEHERAFWQQLGRIGGDGRSEQQAAPSWDRRRFLWGSAAAAAVAMAATPSLWRWAQQDFSTAAGQQARIRLPDGSDAWLNTDSAIALDFSADRRRVRLLHGEALFQTAVSAASRFEVVALGGVIDTAAAAFSVAVWDETAAVRVADGQVRVAGAADSVTLHAHQQTRYRTAQAPARATPFELTELAWRDKRVIFEGRPLVSALKELGRYVPEKVVLSAGAAGAVPVSGVFATDQALAALMALARTQGLSVRRVPGLFILIA